MKLGRYDEKRVDAKMNLELAIGAYLVAAGWKYTSQNPASTWLWCYTLEDGTRVMVSQETAVDLVNRGMNKEDGA